MSGIPRNIGMVVSNGSMDGTGAARLGTWVVHPDQFEEFRGGKLAR